MEGPLKRSTPTTAATPWSNGPSELLAHAVALLREDDDSKRRLAMILIDNAVELSIKTFLTLPTRITGLDEPASLPRAASFPELVAALEMHAPSIVNAVSLGEIEWFHRIRNVLYHQGNGVTVDRLHAQAYADTARVLLKALFDADVPPPAARSEPRAPFAPLLGRRARFFKAWADLEFLLAASGYPQHLPHDAEERVRVVLDGLLNESEVDELIALRRLKQAWAAGEVRNEDEIPGRVVDDVLRLSDRVQQPPVAGSNADLHGRVSRAWPHFERAIEQKGVNRYAFSIASEEDLLRLFGDPLGHETANRLIVFERIVRRLRSGNAIATEVVDQRSVEWLWGVTQRVADIPRWETFPEFRQLRSADEALAECGLSQPQSLDEAAKAQDFRADQQGMIAAYNYDVQHATRAQPAVPPPRVDDPEELPAS